MARDAEREAIIRAAKEMGMDPAYALAIAERESNFDPGAKSSKTIRGIYQMTGGARAKYGIHDSTDPYTQTRGWGAMQTDVRKEMAGPLGREPTTAEGYLGHHFGGVRAGRMLKMDPDTPVQAVFTAQELRENPHIVKAGTVGNLNKITVADIERRMSKYGGALPERYETGAVSSPSAPSAGAASVNHHLPAAAPAPIAPAAPQQAAQGPNSFKGMPNFSSPPLEHLPLLRPQMPNFAVQGIPMAPQAPQQAGMMQNPVGTMLGQMANDVPAEKTGQQESNLMGIAV